MRRLHPVSILYAGSVLLLASAVAAHLAGLRVCTSESLPLGLYRAHHGPVARGSLVLVCLPHKAAALALERGYVPPGRCPGGSAPLGKVVLAVAGDRLSFDAGGIRLDGEQVPASAPLGRDAAGRLLPHAPFGQQVLPSGALWIHSPFHSRSFDSRYFGPVPVSEVEAVLTPVLLVAPLGRDFRMRKSMDRRTPQ
jgi:conjugative transfer signal peptidase TraF